MKLCVLILRGLGAAHTGPYGNRWVDTPSLNALATQAVVFETRLAAHPGDARRTWRTGRFRFDASQPEDGPDLLRTLRDAAVPMRLLLDASHPPPDDFRAGWDEVREAADQAATIAAGKEMLGELTRADGGLLWIELASLLPPWDVREEFTAPYFAEDGDGDGEESEQEEPIEPISAPPAGPIDAEDDLLYEVIQTSYAAAISQLDAALADLLDGLPDDVALLLTSDHGQALGEHGVVGLVPHLHREVVQVPLLLRLPGRPTRRRAAGLTLSVDIAATIADIFDLPLPDTHGRSLLPLAGLGEAERRDYACMGLAGEWAMWTAEWALRLPLSAEPRLYVRPDDRTETNNVSQHHVEACDALAQTLRAFVAASAKPGPLEAPSLRTAVSAE